MKKRFGFIFMSSLLLLLYFNTGDAVFASKQVILKSTKSSAKEFDEISIQKVNKLSSEDEAEYVIVIEDEVNESGKYGYNVMIDPDNGTYTVEELSDQETINILEETNDTELSVDVFDNLLKDNGLYDDEYEAMYSNKKSYLSVRVSTVDPPGAILNYTRNRLEWTHNGSYVINATQSQACSASSPSAFLTKWTVDTCDKEIYKVVNGGKTINSKLFGSYYNYDFGNKNKITRSSHDILIEGYYDGKSWYKNTFKKSGELNSLLRFKVATEKK